MINIYIYTLSVEPRKYPELNQIPAQHWHMPFDNDGIWIVIGFRISRVLGFKGGLDGFRVLVAPWWCDLDVGRACRYEFLEDDKLVAKLTDQRFLLARGFVICDVSALIDHDLLHGCISREWCDSWCVAVCSNKRFAETEQNVVVCSCSNCRCRRTSTRHTCIHDCCSDDYGACEITY